MGGTEPLRERTAASLHLEAREIVAARPHWGPATDPAMEGLYHHNVHREVPDQGLDVVVRMPKRPRPATLWRVFREAHIHAAVQDRLPNVPRLRFDSPQHDYAIYDFARFGPLPPGPLSDRIAGEARQFWDTLARTPASRFPGLPAWAPRTGSQYQRLHRADLARLHAYTDARWPGYLRGLGLSARAMAPALDAADAIRPAGALEICVPDFHGGNMKETPAGGLFVCDLELTGPHDARHALSVALWSGRWTAEQAREFVDERRAAAPRDMRASFAHGVEQWGIFSKHWHAMRNVAIRAHWLERLATMDRERVEMELPQLGAQIAGFATFLPSLVRVDAAEAATVLRRTVLATLDTQRAMSMVGLPLPRTVGPQTRSSLAANSPGGLPTGPDPLLHLTRGLAPIRAVRTQTQVTTGASVPPTLSARPAMEQRRAGECLWDANGPTPQGRPRPTGLSRSRTLHPGMA